MNPRRGTAGPGVVLAAIALAALAGFAPAAGAEDEPHTLPIHGDPHRVRDPLVPILRRLHEYFAGHLQDGITMDSRYPINPSEAIRMGVVCQLLGYAELAKLQPGVLFRGEVQRHADFLVAKLDSVRSHSPFDGMLGYSLVQAYEQTGDPAHRAAAQEVIQELEDIPTSECILNGGLMVAMATADWANLTGDEVAAKKTRDIITQLPPFQNADGSFPHWCPGSEDIHYTGWMGLELVLIERMTADPRLDTILRRMWAFLDARLGEDGVSRYEEPCPAYPGCVVYYDSQHSGCGYDYDTRGITVEPAYNALLFDHYRARTYHAAMGFLATLERGGTFKDKYGWIPPPGSPDYPWSTADTSVANMSINFWALATLLTGRDHPLELVRGWLDVAPAAAAVAGAAPAAGAAGLSLSILGPGTLRFSLPARARVTLAVHDIAGRRVRTLVEDVIDAGEHTVAWDGHDANGVRCPPGAYFTSLRAGDAARTARVIVIR